MNKKRLRLTAAVIAAIIAVSGCGTFGDDSKGSDKDTTKNTTIEAENVPNKEEETTTETKQEETTTEEPTRDKLTFEGDINSLPNDSVTWGVGVHTYDDKRPVDPVNMQEKYGSKYAVNWLMENEPVIYLTFDEGYENGFSGKILDVLKEKNIKAVFFVTMPYVKTEQELVRRMIDEGHIVGSHSVTHPSKGMPSISVEKQINEYKELHQYMLDNFNYEMWLFRPPTGAFSEQSLAVAQSCGYRTIQWSFAYADWDPANQMEVTKALNNAVGKLHNGAIYLLHAVSETNANMLADFIDQTIAKGYTFKSFE